MQRTRMLLGAVCALAILAADANATTRRASLGGNVLLADTEDVFVFPQEVTRYRNLVHFDMGTTADEGAGVFIFGNGDHTWAVALHRADIAGSAYAEGDANPLAGAPNPIQSNIANFADPHTVLDLLYGGKGATSWYGFRLSIASGGSATDPGNGGTEVANAQSIVSLGAGLSQVMDNFDYQLGLRLFYSTAGDEADGNENQVGARFGIDVDGRAYMGQPGEDGMRMGLLGHLTFDSTSVEESNANFTESSSEFGLAAGVGPVYEVNGTRIAAYAVLSFSNDTNEPNDQVDNDDSSTNTIIIPLVNVAADMKIVEWLFMRAGMQYTFGVDLASQGDAQSIQRNGTFGWSAGFGIPVDNFQLDLAVQHAFLTQGPDFIGGDGQLASSVAASYKW